MSIEQNNPIPARLMPNGDLSPMAHYLEKMAKEAKQTNCKLVYLMQRLDLFASQVRQTCSSPTPSVSKSVEKVPAITTTYTFNECFRRAESAVKEKKLDEAFQYYLRALELACSKQERAETYWRLGNIAKNQKDFLKARTLFLQASSYVPLHSKLGIDLSLSLGDVEKQLNNYEKAVEQYRQVYDPRLTVDQKMAEPISSDEQKSQACFGLGEIAKFRGDFCYAKSCFLGAIKWTRLIAVRRETYWRLGEIARIQGKIQEAKEH